VEQIDRQSSNSKLLHQRVSAPRAAQDSGGVSSDAGGGVSDMVMLLRQNVRALAKVQKQVQRNTLDEAHSCSRYWACEADALRHHVAASQQQKGRADDTARTLTESIDRTNLWLDATNVGESGQVASPESAEKVLEKVCGDGTRTVHPVHLVPPTPANFYVPTPAKHSTSQEPLRQQRLNFDPVAAPGLL
jgi:hypothetical protein